MKTNRDPRAVSSAFAPPLLDNNQAADFLGLGRRTLENWRVRGDGPRFLRVGRAIRYARSDLEAWLDTRRFRSTSEADNSEATKAAPNRHSIRD